MMNNYHDERRKHQRIYRNFIMSYYEKGKSILRHNVTQVNNVSKGGLNFSSTYPLALGILVSIDLKTPFLGDSIRLEGIVLDCKEKVPELIYEIRLQFQELSEQSLAVLDKIEDYSKEKEE